MGREVTEHWPTGLLAARWAAFALAPVPLFCSVRFGKRTTIKIIGTPPSQIHNRDMSPSRRWLRLTNSPSSMEASESLTVNTAAALLGLWPVRLRRVDKCRPHGRMTLLRRPEHALTTLAWPTSAPTILVATGDPANSAAASADLGPDTHSTVAPRVTA